MAGRDCDVGGVEGTSCLTGVGVLLGRGGAAGGGRGGFGTQIGIPAGSCVGGGDGPSFGRVI